MEINVFALIFMGILKLSLSFQLVTADGNYDTESGIETFPFESAKIVKHRSRYCITHRGETYCVRMNRAPGDPKEVAEMYNIWMKNMNDKISATDAKNLLRSMLRTLKQKKLSQGIKKLSQRVKQEKSSQQGKDRNKKTQKNKQVYLRQNGKQQKLKLVKQGKVRQVRQRRVKPVAWQVTGHDSHVPPIPRHVRR